MASAGALPLTNDGGPENPRNDGNRGRNRGRGGNGRGRGRGDNSRANQGRSRAAADAPPARPNDAGPLPSNRPVFKAPPEPADDDGEDADGEVCFICANRIIHYAVAPCNHLTCHVCSLRLRALYKNKDCPHCRTAASYVIFTDEASKRFQDYSDADITSTDDNSGIKYANEDIVGDTVLLLRYNCPDVTCDYAGLGWKDLHRHVRAVHRKKMCDLCTRNKKVFTHEHDMFTDKEHQEHTRDGDDKPGAVDQTGFKGHPLCTFCGSRFYDDDKLYEHCRNKHERCFICDRRDSRIPHYYVDYNSLEEHFKDDHFICLDRECLEKKFVVFATDMDLKAHQLSEHGSSLSKDVRRDARMVDLSGFDVRQPYQQERRGGGHREGRGRGRDPNSEPLPMSSAQPMRRDEMAFQRQMAIHTAQSISNRTFGGQLTTATGPRPGPSASSAQTRAGQTPAAQSSQPVMDAFEHLSLADPAQLTREERATLTRHGAVIERASNMVGNDPAKMASFRSYVSSLNRESITAEQLVEAFCELFSESSLTALATLTREVSDLFEDKHKGELVRKAWHNWRASNEDYPSLPGLGGMHGATTASSGWAAAAAASPTATLGTAAAAAQSRASTRVLRLKNSTRRGSGPAAGPAIVSVPGSVPTPAIRVNNGPRATPSAAFPALPSASSTGAAARAPSWIGSSTQSSRITAAVSSSSPILAANRATTTTSRPPAVRNQDAFPALPTAPKPATQIFGYGRGVVRRDYGAGRDTGFAWGASSTQKAAPAQAEAGESSSGQGKKANKKRQVLQWS